MPRLFWVHMEEGKLTTMLQGVRSGSVKDDKKSQETAKNVVKYLEMKEGGHYMYGISYLVSQVSDFLVVISLRNQEFKHNLYMRHIKLIIVLIISGPARFKCHCLHMVHQSGFRWKILFSRN